MAEKTGQFIMVDRDVLPDVFGKVLEVKRRIAEQPNVSLAAACKDLGLSRSAYYKYKNRVFLTYEKLPHQIVHLTVTLRDQAGVLSSVLGVLYRLHANILTLNQSIPANGVAFVTVSLQMDADSNALVLTREVTDVDGVVNVQFLSGE